MMGKRKIKYNSEALKEDYPVGKKGKEEMLAYRDNEEKQNSVFIYVSSIKKIISGAVLVQS